MYVHDYTHAFRMIGKYWIKIDNSKIFDDLRAIYKSHRFIMFMIFLYISFLYIYFVSKTHDSWLEKLTLQLFNFLCFI